MINNKEDGWYDDLLPGTIIKTRVEDSKCDATVMAKAVWNLMEWPHAYGSKKTRLHPRPRSSARAPSHRFPLSPPPPPLFPPRAIPKP